MTRLACDVLDASNNPIGPGPITKILTLFAEDALDQVGMVGLSVPATDRRTVELIYTGRRIRVWTDDGFERIGIIRNLNLSAGAQAILNVDGPGLLAELADATAGWWAIYRNEDANTVVLPNMISGTGWTLGSVDAGLGNYAAVLSGETRLTMLQKLRATKGRHIRLGSGTRVLDFGAFGADSGVTFIKVDQHRVAQESNTQLGIIGAIERKIDNWPVVNRIFPWGAGEDDGYSRLKVTLQDIPYTDPRAPNIRVARGLRGVETTTIAGSDVDTLRVVSSSGFLPGMQLFVGNRNDYSVFHYVNITVDSVPDSTTIQVNISVSGPMSPAPGSGLDVISWPQYFIEDAALYAAEPREATIVFSDIDVVDRGSPNPSWVPAAQALYDRASAHLQWFRTPQVVYGITVIRAPLSLRVGDRVRLHYRGAVRQDGVPVDYLDVNDLFFVTKLRRSWTGDGTPSVALDLSNIDRQPIADDMVIVDAMDDLGVLQTRA